MKIFVSLLIFAFGAMAAADQTGQSKGNSESETPAKAETKEIYVVCTIGCNVVSKGKTGYEQHLRMVEKDQKITVPLNAKRQWDLEAPAFTQARARLFGEVKSQCGKFLKDGVSQVVTSTAWTTGADQQGLSHHSGAEEFNAETGKFKKVAQPSEQKSCGVSVWSLKNRPWTDDGSG